MLQMIKAMIFDMDGTLVQTERLKAISYAKAAVELCPHHLEEDEVIEAFKDVVGLSRKEVAQTLMERFDLEEKAKNRMDEFGVSKPWQAYVQVRLEYYDDMIKDADTIRDNQWEHNLKVLKQAREQGCKTALATMSHCPQVERILNILDLQDAFDFVATRDDVENGKPDPEIYHLVADELQTNPKHCLVLEDSPSGVKAAIAANMHVIAVSTLFTEERLHVLDEIDKKWIVDDPSELSAVMKRAFEAF